MNYSILMAITNIPKSWPEMSIELTPCSFMLRSLCTSTFPTRSLSLSVTLSQQLILSERHTQTFRTIPLKARIVASSRRGALDFSPLPLLVRRRLLL